MLWKAMSSNAIDSVLNEQRVFEPSDEFRAASQIKSRAEYERLYKEAKDDPEGFWAKIAQELHWFKPWDRVLEWKLPFAKWFLGGELNISYNCLDRHVATWRKNKAAIQWEGEPGDSRTLTYQQLLREVSKCANVLKSLGVQKGDRVAIYMGMVPELPIAMLACARIGAAHTVVFGGFSAQALIDRINDCGAVGGDHARRGFSKRDRGQAQRSRGSGAAAVLHGEERAWFTSAPAATSPCSPGRDHWWHELMETASDDCPAEPLDAEHPLYLLYTSGTTGKPKGILHTTGGYSVGSYITAKWIFDLRDEDTYWCSADIGWVTGHTYVVYGMLQNGASVVIYEGGPTWPEPDRFWRIIQKYKVSIFYTAPTSIRAFMRLGEQWPRKHDLSSLRLLGSVGEPINPEAWMWYREVIGGGRCPIVDTWWQTETGATMISPAARRDRDQARFSHAAIARRNRRRGGSRRRERAARVRRIPGDQTTLAFHVADHLWRSRALQGAILVADPGMYFAGDGARIDSDGYFWLMGRVDDVLNVAGHRLSTMEIESALVANPMVAEAAVVGRPDDVKGQAVSAFVTLKADSAQRGKQEFVAPVGGQRNRPHRQARRYPLHRFASQDAQRQDHAPPAARAGDQRGSERRHHDAGRFLRAGEVGPTTTNNV
jgi:acetyl-CoA synthetase